MYYYSHLEDYVKKIYYSLSITKPQQIDLKMIARNLSINVRFFDEESEAVFYKGTYWIFINEDQSLQKQWQDFCHELCHVLLHWGNQKHLPKSFLLYQEMKANSFMYHFCVPTFMLEKLILPNNSDDAAELVAETFNVEVSFAARRLNRWLLQKSSFEYYQRLKEVGR